MPPMTPRPCRFCQATLSETFADLGTTPLSNAFIPPDKAHLQEPVYPLHAYVCGTCRLVQLEQFETPRNIFGDYIYFSSYSDTWLRHAEAYAHAMTRRLGLTPVSLVVEVASNDGYLLQYFQQLGINVLGIEPAANVAAAAIGKDIPTRVVFFSAATAARLRHAGVEPDLMTANNVLAHVPDLNDFVRGFTILLPPQGVATFEFPHLLRLMQETQFDTIYHEHFSYFSLHVVRRIFAGHGLRVFDVEELPTHGGSLRVFACHAAAAHHRETPAVGRVLANEIVAGLESNGAYRHFGRQMVTAKAALLRFLTDARTRGKRVAGYGAPAKGNTLLNYCGIGSDLIAFTVDRNPHKQGMLLPGSHIPVRAPDAILKEKPDYMLILPWNLRDEITAEMDVVRTWGGQFVVPIPTTRVLP
jgi:SAM-dependent methyltransferase